MEEKRVGTSRTGFGIGSLAHSAKKKMKKGAEGGAKKIRNGANETLKALSPRRERRSEENEEIVAIQKRMEERESPRVEMPWTGMKDEEASEERLQHLQNGGMGREHPLWSPDECVANSGDSDEQVMMLRIEKILRMRINALSEQAQQGTKMLDHGQVTEHFNPEAIRFIAGDHFPRIQALLPPSWSNGVKQGSMTVSKAIHHHERAVYALCKQRDPQAAEQLNDLISVGKARERVAQQLSEKSLAIEEVAVRFKKGAVQTAVADISGEIVRTCTAITKSVDGDAARCLAGAYEEFRQQCGQASSLKDPRQAAHAYRLALADLHRNMCLSV